MASSIRLFFILLLVLVSANPVFAERIVKVSAPPSIWIQEDGDTLTGPIIDLLKEVFSPAGVEISTQKLPWVRAVKNMQSGQLDIIPVIFHTLDREKSMAFSVPYVDVPTVVFVKKGKTFPFTDIEDLIGRRGMMVRNDSISPEFNRAKSKLNLTVVSDYATILKMLEAERADYAVCPKYGFLVAAKKLGIGGKIENLSVPIASRNLHIAISRKSSFLNHLQDIDAKIQAMQSDGTMDKIVAEALSRAAEKE